MTAPRRSGAGRAGARPQPAAGRAPGHRGPLRPSRAAGGAAVVALPDTPDTPDSDDTAVTSLDAARQPRRSVAGSPERGEALQRRGGNRLTGRATALFVVLAMLAVAYTWPVKEYLRQHGELARLRAASAATQARVDTLEAQKKRWADPAYVQAQARERLHFVLPGETAFVVLQPDHPALPQTLPQQTAQVLPAWYTELWDSVRGADQPTRR
jgi:cell division protein FtsB